MNGHSEHRLRPSGPTASLKSCSADFSSSSCRRFSSCGWARARSFITSASTLKAPAASVRGQVFRSRWSARYLRSCPLLSVIPLNTPYSRSPDSMSQPITSSRCSLSQSKVSTSIGIPVSSITATADTGLAVERLH